MEKAGKSLGEALEYMCNLPKIYVEELELNGNIFWGLLGCICHLQTERDGSSASKYMPLDYDVVQKYRIRGFPTKYVCSHYSQYCRMINAAILIYYKALRNVNCEFSCEEYEKLFGNFFLSKEDLSKLRKAIEDNEDNGDIEDIETIEAIVVSRFEEEEPGKIEKAKQSGDWQKKFEENWKKKRSQLLENQIEKGQMIRDNLFLEDEFNELVDEGTTLKRVINFLDKLENESHARSANNVLIPHEEYRALHDMLAERPWEKAILQEKHAKLIHKLERVFSLEAKKKV